MATLGQNFKDALKWLKTKKVFFFLLLFFQNLKCFLRQQIQDQDVYKIDQALKEGNLGHIEETRRVLFKRNWVLISVPCSLREAVTYKHMHQYTWL